MPKEPATMEPTCSLIDCSSTPSVRLPVTVYAIPQAKTASPAVNQMHMNAESVTQIGSSTQKQHMSDRHIRMGVSPSATDSTMEMGPMTSPQPTPRATIKKMKLNITATTVAMTQQPN